MNCSFDDGVFADSYAKRFGKILSSVVFATTFLAAPALAEVLRFECTPNGMEDPLPLTIDTETGTGSLTGNPLFNAEYVVLQIANQAVWLRHADEDKYVFKVTGIRRGKGDPWSLTQIDNTASAMANIVGACVEVS